MKRFSWVNDSSRRWLRDPGQRREAAFTAAGELKALVGEVVMAGCGAAGISPIWWFSWAREVASAVVKVARGGGLSCTTTAVGVALGYLAAAWEPVYTAYAELAGTVPHRRRGSSDPS